MTPPKTITFPPWFRRLTALTGLTVTLSFLAGCGGSTEGDAMAEGEEAAASPTADQPVIAPEEYYATKFNLPPDLFEAYEAGRVSEEEIQQRRAAGEFENFFIFASLADIPADLNWEDGMYLPDLGSPNAKKGGTRFGRLQDFPRTLRTIGPDSNGSFRPYILDYNGMEFAHRHPTETDITATGHRYFPGIAQEWAVDKAGKRVFVRLNPEAKWSDGHPITVEDVFYMFYYYQSPHLQAPWYTNFYNRNYTNVTRYDDLTFSIELPEAKPDMNSRVLELRPQPAHFYGTLGPDFVDRYQWQYAPTTGPYIVNPDDNRSMAKGRFIRMERNDDWWARDNKFWRNRFNYDVMHFTVIRDTAKAFEAFKKGELDAFSMTDAEYHYEKFPNDTPLIQDGYVAKYTYYTDMPRPTFALWINSHRPLLDDVNVRVGIQHATNWQRVIDEFFRGDFDRMQTNATGYGEFTHPTLRSRMFDVEKALAAFAKAGFTERNSNGILVNASGQELAFTLTTGYEAYAPILTILQEEALKAGLNYRLEVLDQTAAWKKVQEKKHEIQFSAFGAQPEMYPRFWETWHSVNAYKADGSLKPQTNNLTVFNNEEMDRLIEAYRASESAEEMIALSHQMQEIIYEEAIFVPGFIRPFMRWASWRWLQWPEDGEVQISRDTAQYYLAWIDEDLKKETQDAMRAGQTFEPVITIWDEHKVDLGPTGDAVSLGQ